MRIKLFSKRDVTKSSLSLVTFISIAGRLRISTFLCLTAPEKIALKQKKKERKKNKNKKN
jgi:Trk-type K+ transport system membrane component